MRNSVTSHQILLCFFGFLLASDARAQTVDPSAHAAAAALFQTVNQQNIASSFFDDLRQSAIQRMVDKGHPHDTAVKVCDEILMPALRANVDELISDRIDIYARHFSIDELHALTSFYKSPLGQKYFGFAGEMRDELQIVGVAWAQRISRGAAEKNREKLQLLGFHP